MLFLKSGLGSSSIFETGNRYKPETLHQELKLIVIKSWVLIPTFLEVTRERLVRGRGLFAIPSVLSILNRANELIKEMSSEFWNLQKRINPDNWIDMYKTEARSPKGFRNCQYMLQLFKNLRDVNVNPRKVLKKTK